MFWFSGNLRDKLARQSLRFRKVMPSKLEIMNLQGQIISTETYQAGTLNNISTSNLKSGVYICKLSNGLFVSTSKFIVQH